MELQHIDHVAITVSDLQRSIAWYRDALGLERRFQDAWGDVPTMMCVGETCVALFISDGPDLAIASRSRLTSREKGRHKSRLQTLRLQFGHLTISGQEIGRVAQITIGTRWSIEDAAAALTASGPGAKLSPN
jgi:catechol 2,3-dioxygenase-like lactoylglutathione lyase family enzyme